MRGSPRWRRAAAASQGNMRPPLAAPRMRARCADSACQDRSPRSRSCTGRRSRCFRPAGSGSSTTATSGSRWRRCSRAASGISRCRGRGASWIRTSRSIRCRIPSPWCTTASSIRSSRPSSLRSPRCRSACFGDAGLCLLPLLASLALLGFVGQDRAAGRAFRPAVARSRSSSPASRLRSGSTPSSSGSTSSRRACASARWRSRSSFLLRGSQAEPLPLGARDRAGRRPARSAPALRGGAGRAGLLRDAAGAAAHGRDLRRRPRGGPAAARGLPVARARRPARLPPDARIRAERGRAGGPRVPPAHAARRASPPPARFRRRRRALRAADGSLRAAAARCGRAFRAVSIAWLRSPSPSGRSPRALRSPSRWRRPRARSRSSCAATASSRRRRCWRSVCCAGAIQSAGPIAWSAGSCVLVAGYALLYLALTPLRNTTGIHWGNRYLLELYPLLAVPCVAGLLASVAASRRLAGLRSVAAGGGERRAPGLLRSICCGASWCSERGSNRRCASGPRRSSSPMHGGCRRRSPREFYRQVDLLLLRRLKQERVLLGRLAQRGSGRFLFVTPDAGRPPERRVRRIEDEGLGFFSLRFESHGLPGR